MANTCKTCRHPQLQDINNLLVNAVPLRTIANQYDLKHPGLIRHKDNCIPRLFEEVDQDRREGLLKDVDDLKAEIAATKTDFIDNGNVRVQLIARRKDAIELEAKLTGAFVKDRDNPNDIKAIAREIERTLLNQGYPPAEVRAEIVKLYPEVSESIH